LFPHNGRSAEAPWRLALITVLQFLEALPDRQAADAVRGRMEWKSLLGLPLEDPGFDCTIPSDFRARLVDGEAEQLLLDALLEMFKGHGWLTARERQRTRFDPHPRQSARPAPPHRLMGVGETLRCALNGLAMGAGDGLLEQSQEDWRYRYGHRIEEKPLPQDAAGRLAVAQTSGRDGWALLADRLAPAAPAYLREMPAVAILRRVWIQTDRYEDGGVPWREGTEIPPASAFISSPYDPQARSGKKYTTPTRWTGDKVPVTATGAPDQPQLILQVATTPAATSDVSMTHTIQADLQQAQVLPAQQFMDAG
jgi:Transposase domain (DUF772)